MVKSLARPVASCVVLLALAAISPEAQAAALFNVTDLTTDPVNYSWDKYPVTYETNPKVVFGWLHDMTPGYYYQDGQGNLHEEIPVASNKYGSISYSIRWDSKNGPSSQYVSQVPEQWSYTPLIGSEKIATSPVLDFNIHGQAVGMNGGSYGTVAVTSPTKAIPDGYLNDDISSQLGINLTQAFRIDDLGRILAYGTVDGRSDEFLLTPVGLPAPAPEPSTIAVLAVGAIAFGLRKLTRKEATR